MSEALDRFLNHYAKAGDHPDALYLTTSKGHDTTTPEINLDEARAHARKILELDGGEHWVDIYTAMGNVVERIERKI